MMVFFLVTWVRNQWKISFFMKMQKFRKQGRIHGYRSRVRVGRGHIWGNKTFWARAVRSKNKNPKKSKMWPTNRPTDRPTDKAGCRVAYTRLKIWALTTARLHTNPPNFHAWFPTASIKSHDIFGLPSLLFFLLLLLYFYWRNSSRSGIFYLDLNHVTKVGTLYFIMECYRKWFKRD